MAFPLHCSQLQTVPRNPLLHLAHPALKTSTHVASLTAVSFLNVLCSGIMDALRSVPYAQTGLEEIFDEDTLKSRIYTSTECKEFAEKQRAGSRERSSPISTRGRSSPTLSRRNSYHIKPDPWVCSSDPTLEGFVKRPGTPSLGACESSVSPKRPCSPLQRSKILAHRDKESFLEEIISLKKAFLDQSAYLQRQKVHATNLETENRKLEKELEEMESQGNAKGAIRTGNASRLRAKLQGLKEKLAEIEATCEAQQEELTHLRRDMRVTRIREVEVERDVFAEEIERLQNFVRRLKALQNRLFCENKQLYRYKDKALQSEAANQRFDKAVAGLQKTLDKTNRELHESTRRANENFIRAKRSERQCQELQEEASVLTKMVEKERSEKLKLQQMIHALQDEVQRLQEANDLRAHGELMQEAGEQDEQGILAKTWGFLHTMVDRGNDQSMSEKVNMAADQQQGDFAELLADSRTSRPKSPTRGAGRRGTLRAAAATDHWTDDDEHLAAADQKYRHSQLASVEVSAITTATSSHSAAVAFRDHRRKSSTSTDAQQLAKIDLASSAVASTTNANNPLGFSTTVSSEHHKIDPSPSINPVAPIHAQAFQTSSIVPTSPDDSTELRELFVNPSRLSVANDLYVTQAAVSTVAQISAANHLNNHLVSSNSTLSTHESSQDHSKTLSGVGSEALMMRGPVVPKLNLDQVGSETKLPKSQDSGQTDSGSTVVIQI